MHFMNPYKQVVISRMFPANIYTSVVVQKANMYTALLQYGTMASVWCSCWIFNCSLFLLLPRAILIQVWLLEIILVFFRALWFSEVKRRSR